MAKKLFRTKFTAKEKEAMRKRALEERASWSLAYQLGVYVGEQIVDKYLPTLSCDSLQTKTNISVTCGEGDECRRLNDVWYNKLEEGRIKVNLEFKDKEKLSGKDYAEIEHKKHEHAAEEWKALRAYHEMLEEKYLPKKIDCRFQFLNVTEENMEEFKKGVGVALWDCDCSHYLCKPEEIEVKADDEGWFTTITLTKG